MRRTDLEAVGLGLLHGPVELVPVSSSGHVAAATWLLGWEDGARRKELEVALHAGSAAALLVVLRPRFRPALLAVACTPPALAGLVLERAIEERLGPAALAGGLLAGALALVLSDRAPSSRDDDQAGIGDGIALGLAQAAALIPGVSRNGATLTAARARGFDRASASRLSWEVALPVVAGATALKAWRLAASARGAAVSSPPAAASSPPAATSPPAASSSAAAHVRALALGAAAAFSSTLATARLIGLERRGPLWPWAVWRVALAGAILAVRHNRSR